jgi:hypothetical protein
MLPTEHRPHDGNWLTQKQNNGAQNVIMLHLRRRLRLESYLWLENYENSFGMPMGA